MIIISKEEINLYFTIEQRIEKRAMELLKWYDSNIEYVLWLDEYYFADIDENNIVYEGFKGSENIQFIIPVKLLIMTEEELLEWEEEYKEQKRIKEEIKKKLKIKEKRLEKERLENGEYKLYLELKEKYGN